MPQSLKFLTALSITSFSAWMLASCAPSEKAPAIQKASQSAAQHSIPEEYRFADFIDGATQLIPADSPEAKAPNAKTTTLKTKQGASTDAGSYAEKSGDDRINHGRSNVVNGIASVSGVLTKRNGSNYGGILLITPSGKAAGGELTTYTHLKITLASTGTHKNLQVRITGSDDQAVFRGCYPVANLSVTAEPQEYTIALNDENFPQLSWCKDLNLPIAQTLKSVRSIDVQDINMPQKAKEETIVEFHVGSMRFTQQQ